MCALKQSALLHLRCWPQEEPRVLRGGVCHQAGLQQLSHETRQLSNCQGQLGVWQAGIIAQLAGAEP